MDKSTKRTALPVHPVPAGLPDNAAWRLRVDGLVAQRLELSAADVNRLERSAPSGDFACEEGWVVPDQQWEGVLVAAALQRAGLLEGARYVRVHAGSYTVVLPLDEVVQGGALLADRLNGAPLPEAHGAPFRLVAPGRECFYSVKWVDRLEVLADAADATGETIARTRIERSQTRG
jgi:DMSO/TMAO reductase YedYZ molybdopterin-dependent catalytic subunit